MANHGAIKKLHALRDRLELRKDDISIGNATLAAEVRELYCRQEQLLLVNEKISREVNEMEQLQSKRGAVQAKLDEFKNEEEALRHAFTTILDHGLKDLKESRRRDWAEAEHHASLETVVREVSVLFEDDEAVFRVVDEAYTFDGLIADACRYFEVHPLDALLVDDRDAPWSGDASVRLELSEFENQYGKVVMKLREAEVFDETDDVDDMFGLLLGKDEEVEVEEEDPDELIRAAAAAAADPVGTAEREAAQRKKERSRKSRLREIPGFIAFLTLFVYANLTRRGGSAGFFQVRATVSAAAAGRPGAAPPPPTPRRAACQPRALAGELGTAGAGRGGLRRL